MDDITISRFIKFRKIDKLNLKEVLVWALDSDLDIQKNPGVYNEYDNVLKLIFSVVKEMQEFMATDEKHKLTTTLDVLGHEIAINPDFLNNTPPWCNNFAMKVLSVEMLKETFDPTDCIPEVIAHFLYSEVTKSPYNEEKANDFVSVIEELPMAPCLQFGTFYLRKLIGLYHANMQN